MPGKTDSVKLLSEVLRVIVARVHTTVKEEQATANMLLLLLRSKEESESEDCHGVPLLFSPLTCTRTHHATCLAASWRHQQQQHQSLSHPAHRGRRNAQKLYHSVLTVSSFNYISCTSIFVSMLESIRKYIEMLYVSIWTACSYLIDYRRTAQDSVV